MKSIRCAVYHRKHHFVVQGKRLCQLCDAHLVDQLIKAEKNA